MAESELAKQYKETLAWTVEAAKMSVAILRDPATKAAMLAAMSKQKDPPVTPEKQPEENHEPEYSK